MVAAQAFAAGDGATPITDVPSTVAADLVALSVLETVGLFVGVPALCFGIIAGVTLLLSRGSGGDGFPRLRPHEWGAQDQEPPGDNARADDGPGRAGGHASPDVESGTPPEQ